MKNEPADVPKKMNCRTPANKKKAQAFIAQECRINPRTTIQNLRQRLLEQLNLDMAHETIAKYRNLTQTGKLPKAKTPLPEKKQLTIVPFEKSSESALAAAARHLHVAMERTGAMEVRVTRAGKVTVIQAEDYQL